MNAVTKLDLIPTYAYTRIYSEGLELKDTKTDLVVKFQLQLI